MVRNVTGELKKQTEKCESKHLISKRPLLLNALISRPDGFPKLMSHQLLKLSIAPTYFQWLPQLPIAVTFAFGLLTLGVLALRMTCASQKKLKGELEERLII